MKTLLKQCAELAMRYKTDDFYRARLQLTLLYTLVTAIILALFSSFLFVRVEQQLGRLDRNSSPVHLITKEQAVAVVQYQNPRATVIDVEEESIHDTLVYTVEINRDGVVADIYVDRATGAIVVYDSAGDERETFNDTLINDFVENLLWANIIILVVTMFLSFLLAGATLRPIQRKMRQQEQFSLDIAHEIRTPLSAMLAAADSVLQKPETPIVYQETLLDIKNEVKRLVTLSEDLLATARNTRPTDSTTVPVAAVVATVAKRLEALAIKKGVTIVVDLEKAFSIIGNKTALERMIENVVHNAIKFSHEKGEIKILVTDKSVVISDSGIGMSVKDQSQVFERFYTADSSRNEFNKQGVGLGLSIVRQIAALHNVAVSVDSE